MGVVIVSASPTTWVVRQRQSGVSLRLSSYESKGKVSTPLVLSLTGPGKGVPERNRRGCFPNGEVLLDRGTSLFTHL